MDSDGWGSMDSNSWLGNSVSDSVDLFEGGVGNSLGSNNGFLGQDGSLLNDGLGDVFGGDDLAGGDMGNGCGFMDHSGFSNGVGDGRNLGGHLSIGMGLSNSIGKVASSELVVDRRPNGTPAAKPGPRSNDNPRRLVNGTGFVSQETYPGPPVSTTASCAKPDRPNPQSTRTLSHAQ